MLTLRRYADSTDQGEGLELPRSREGAEAPSGSAPIAASFARSTGLTIEAQGYPEYFRNVEVKEIDRAL